MPDSRDSIGGEEFDYDDTEEHAPLTGEEPKAPKWNIFRQVPAEEASGSAQEHNVYDACVKILKVVAYLLSFVLVLVGCVVAKGTSLFMTSQLKKGKTLEYCDTRSGIGRSWRVDLPEVEMVAWVWCLFLAFIVPEVGTFVRSARIVLFKSFKAPALWELATVAFLESLHTVGMALLLFTALPELDSVRALMLTNCVCLLPAVLGLLSRRAEDDGTLTMVVDGLAILCQLCGCVVWPVMEAMREDGNMTLVWSIPVSLILTSFGWWENYVEEREPSGNRRDNPNEGGIFDAVLPGQEEERGSRASLLTLLGNIKYRMRRRRYIIYLAVSLWKIALFFGMMVLLMMSRMDNVKLLFTELRDGFASHEMTVNETGGSIQHSYSAADSFSTDFMETKTIWSRARTPAYVWLVQLFAAYVAYITGKFACKIYIQPFSFALPVSLTVPCSLSLLLLLCGKRADDACCFQDGIPAYLFFECPHGGYINSLLTDYAVWMWVLWMFSQTWITLHIWTPRCERLAATEKLFVSPMYNSVLIDQSLALNRRIDDGPDRLIDGLDLDSAMDDKPGNEFDEVSEDSDPNSNGSNIHHTDTIPRILGCATMWHEDKNEMLLMLQSVAHIDADQSARRCAQKYLRIVDPDYYLFKTHIFFDDAFEISDDETEEQFVINRFVRTLCESIEEACSNVHGVNIDLPPPTKIPTPYGGRLIYTLPGKTEIVVHLKDKDKIRHRKRWSQVMYLYYLLGYKLMEQDIPTDRKEVIAENTYLLALDGDIDFRPDAMKLLVDLMKKNKMLGAACGRIHPVGSGPMVWYQLFEYAVGHWLQKATEHTIGCVLCSPGCFSLFRARALMDDNVMKTYTTPPTEARHYVQYDQGEDRWLCTLLLQRGYRVEYSAASDAYTHAPEEFNIFYNQRRRWVPSTMANILDLLQSSKRTVRINDNISTLYVAYQVMLMIGSILGPGTIFLMLIGSFNAAFGLSFPMAMVYNAIPVVIFVGACFFCDSKIQLVLAQLLTAVYTVVMVIVVVGLALQFVQEGLESPTAIFFLATMGSFVITAMLHPMEFYCLPALVVYYVTVPSMYFLLIVYSFTNMNNVSWGTREVAVKQRKSKKQKKEEVAVIEAAKKQPGGILGFLQQFNNTVKDEDGAVDFSLGNVFRIMCCTSPKGIDEREQLKRIADSIENMNKRMDALEGRRGRSRRTNSRSSLRSSNQMGMLKEANESDADATSEGSEDSDASEEIVMKQRDFLKNPLWMEDPIFSDRRCKTEFLSQHEIEFWQSLIKQYLFPLDENAEEKKRIAGELADLRTAVCFSFLMINLLFVVAIFILQLHQDELYVNWPLGKTYNIKYTQNAVGSSILIRVTNLPLEPIGFMFVIFFAIILVIQFIAMLFHRFATISHILSLVSLRTQEDIPNEINKIAKDMQRMKERRESTESTNQMDRRKTIHRLEHEQKSRRITFSLDDNFKQRMEEMESEEIGMGGRDSRMTKRRATIKAAQERRKSQMMERRKSRASFAASSVLRSRHSSVRSPSTPSTSSQLPASRSSRAGLDNEAYHHSDDEGDDVFQETTSRPQRV